jgi:hypothetical protein
LATFCGAIFISWVLNNFGKRGGDKTGNKEIKKGEKPLCEAVFPVLVDVV